MSEEISDEPVVVYSVRELLEDIRGTVKGLDHKLDNKADKSEVVALDKRLDVVEGDVQVLKAHSTHNRNTIALAVSILGVVGSPILYVVLGHVIK